MFDMLNELRRTFHIDKYNHHYLHMPMYEIDGAFNLESCRCTMEWNVSNENGHLSMNDQINTCNA